MQPTSAEVAVRAVIEADEDELLELDDPDEVPEDCEEVALDTALDTAEEALDAAAATLELAEATADEVEAEAAAVKPEAEAEAEDELDEEEAAAAPETILPLPQGIAGPSGWRAKGAAVTAPLSSAMGKRVVQVGS